MNKKLLLILLSIIYIFSSVPALAVSPTPTPTTDLTAKTQEIKDRVKERIQEVRNTSNRKIGVWGTIKEVNDSNLTLTTSDSTQIVDIDDQTKILLNQKYVKSSDLSAGNFAIVMGNLDTNSNLEAKRIVALVKPPKPVTARQVLVGKVTDISKDENIFVLTPLKGATTSQVQVNDQTTITKKVDVKVQKVEFSALGVGDKAVVVTIKGKSSNVLTAKLVHIIPGASTQTPQANPTAKPTKKPTATPTPEE